MSPSFLPSRKIDGLFWWAQWLREGSKCNYVISHYSIINIKASRGAEDRLNFLEGQIQGNNVAAFGCISQRRKKFSGRTARQ